MSSIGSSNSNYSINPNGYPPSYNNLPPANNYYNSNSGAPIPVPASIQGIVGALNGMSTQVGGMMTSLKNSGISPLGQTAPTLNVNNTQLSQMTTRQQAQLALAAGVSDSAPVDDVKTKSDLSGKSGDDDYFDALGYDENDDLS